MWAILTRLARLPGQFQGFFSVNRHPDVHGWLNRHGPATQMLSLTPLDGMEGIFVKRLTRAALLIISIIGFVLVPIGTSAAAATTGAGTTRIAPQVSCSGYGCDGQPPDVSGCAATAITAEFAQIKDSTGRYLGQIQLRYSTACRTVWARILSVYRGSEYAAVVRNSDGTFEECFTDSFSSTLGAYSCFSTMLYDGGVTSFAVGDSPSSDNSVFYSNTTSSY
jgi:hypothetical protein